MLADGLGHLGQPGPIFEKLQNLRRGKKLDGVRWGGAERLEQAGGNQNRHIMGLAAQHPCRLFHGEPGGRLPDQCQELMLLVFHSGLKSSKPECRWRGALTRPGLCCDELRLARIRNWAFVLVFTLISILYFGVHYACHNSRTICVCRQCIIFTIRLQELTESANFPSL